MSYLHHYDWPLIISGVTAANMPGLNGILRRNRTDSISTVMLGDANVWVLCKSKEQADAEFQACLDYLDERGIKRRQRGKDPQSTEYGHSFTERRIEFGCSDKRLRIINMAGQSPQTLLGCSGQIHERHGETPDAGYGR